jgi:hypothetical protein
MGAARGGLERSMGSVSVAGAAAHPVRRKFMAKVS